MTFPKARFFASRFNTGHMGSVLSFQSHSLFLMTMDFWMNPSQLPFKMSHSLHCLPVVAWPNSLGKKTTEVMFCASILTQITSGVIYKLVCPSNSDATFDHLVKVVTPDLSILKVSFPVKLISNLWGDTLRLWISCFPTTFNSLVWHPQMILPE